MSYLDHITTGRKSVPRRTVIYGSHGVGKTTWAAGWPKPVLLPTEDGHHHVDVASGPKIQTSEGLHKAIEAVTDSDFETIIIDSIDWAEKIIQEELDASNFDQSWGKGALEVGHRVSRVLRLLDAARDAGKHVVLIGHEQIVTVVRPDGSSFGQHDIKLSKHSSRVVSEWADEILFASRDYLVRSSDNKFGGVGVDKGTRSIHTVGSPSFAAKNRIPDLPEKFDLTNISGYVRIATSK